METDEILLLGGAALLGVWLLQRSGGSVTSTVQAAVDAVTGTSGSATPGSVSLPPSLTPAQVAQLQAEIQALPQVPVNAWASSDAATQAAIQKKLDLLLQVGQAEAI